jgi:hypothetical protein
VYFTARLFLQIHAAIFACALILAFISSGGGFSPNIHNQYFPFYFWTVGIWLTSLSFKDVGNNLKAMAFLLIPANPIEKYLVKFLVSSLGFIFVGSAVYAGSAAFITLFLHLTNRSPLPSFELFHLSHLSMFANYFVYHAVFLAGSIYFKKRVITKTTLFVALYFICLFGFASGVLYLLFGSADAIGSGIKSVIELYPLSKTAVKIYTWGLVMPSLWLLTFVKFREHEVADGF